MKGKYHDSAKHKLNSVYILLIFAAAGFAGGVAGSWAVFWLILILLVGVAIHNGCLRL